MASENVTPEGPPLQLPADLSHHFSAATKNRQANTMKRFYRFFQIPGIGNLAGGLPNVSMFPFDTLEAQVAKPDRWAPTPNEPTTTIPEPPASKDPPSSHHMTVPKIEDEKDPLKKIDLSTALQYGTAQGYPPLRSFIRQFARDHLHPTVPYLGGPEVILTAGATDGFGKAVELIVEPWVEGRDPIEARPALLCELFVYSNGPNTAIPKGVRVVPVAVDSEGMAVEGKGALRDILDNWDLSQGRRPHFMYTVTMGHNPTSGVLSIERRREIYALCQKYDIIICEDDPYWYLQFPSAATQEAKSRGLPAPAPKPVTKPARSSGFDFLDSLVPSYLSIDTDGRVIRLDTFSKTIAPGCRLGWITAQPAFVERLLCIAETSTQQPSGFVQSTVAELVMGPQPEALSRFLSLSLSKRDTFASWQMAGWVRWLEGLRGAYERRMNAMCSALDDHAYELKQSTPSLEADADWGVITKTRLLSFDWSRGGMFVWVRVHFEDHPLWQVTSDDFTVDGTALCLGLMAFCTHDEYLVCVAPGIMFGATDEVAKTEAWKFFRLCFAAEAEDNVGPLSARFGTAVQKFWRIKSVDEMRKLVDEIGYTQEGGVTALKEGLAEFAMPMGC